MIVVVIIGILSGAVTLSTRHYLNRAKQNRARSDIATYVNALESFYGVNGHYPDNQQGLAVLVPQFIDKLRNDPWGRPYVYNQPGKEGPYDIISYGADGQEGGEGADADITNHDEEPTAANSTNTPGNNK
jgi:general secretion pathway protein G